MPTAKIDTASSGDNTIVAAVAGRTIRVLHYTMIGTAVSVKWKSGSTDISGAMLATYGLQATAPVDSMGDTLPLVETAAGEALLLNLSGATQVSGHITYEVRG